MIAEIIGFGAVLYAASQAANYGWNSPDVLTFFIIGGLGLAAFAVIELFIAKRTPAGPAPVWAANFPECLRIGLRQRDRPVWS